MTAMLADVPAFEEAILDAASGWAEGHIQPNSHEHGAKILRNQAEMIAAGLPSEGLAQIEELKDDDEIPGESAVEIIENMIAMRAVALSGNVVSRAIAAWLNAWNTGQWSEELLVERAAMIFATIHATADAAEPECECPDDV